MRWREDAFGHKSKGGSGIPGPKRQLEHHDPHTVLPLLTAERIRRATQPCDAIIADSATHEVTREAVGINEFFQAVERLHQTLLSLLKDDEA